jgi:Fe-S cluster assembly ATP-binding protein
MSLSITHFNVALGKRTILKDISLEIQAGKIHALMGPNGSGKSTLSQALMGSPNYKVSGEKMKISVDGKNITDLKPDERARAGLFLAFQNPVAIPGVTVANLLRAAFMEMHPQNDKKGEKKIHNPALSSVFTFNKMLVEKAKLLSVPQEFLSRGLNEEFSGGEKKKLEMLQALVLEPKYAIFDEIDTGLDVDALKIVAEGIFAMKKNKIGILLITHYQRILRFAKPDFVHILIGGKIVEEGPGSLAMEIEKNGYKKWIK